MSSFACTTLLLEPFTYVVYICSNIFCPKNILGLGQRGGGGGVFISAVVLFENSNPFTHSLFIMIPSIKT